MKRLLTLLTLVLAMATSITTLTSRPADAVSRDRTIEVTDCRAPTEVHPGCGLQQIVREPCGTLSGRKAGHVETGTWVYDRQTKTITMQFDNYPGVVYMGQKRRGCFSDTILAPSHTGTWEGCFIS